MNPIEVNVSLQSNNHEFSLGMNEFIQTAGDYEQLDNLPSINGVKLIGDLSSDDLGIGGDVTGVKGDAETEYRKGNVNLTAENIGTYTKEEIEERFKEPSVDGELLKI